VSERVLITAGIVELCHATSATAAAASYAQADKAVSVQITRSGAGYNAQVRGRTHKTRGRSPLVVSCQHKGKGLQLSVRPCARNRTLQQVAGSTLSIGFTTPTAGRAVNVRTTFRVG